MVSSKEGSLPQSLINMEGAHNELKSGLSPEVRGIIGEKLPKLISFYQENLRQDVVDAKQADLAAIKRAELKNHLAHLDELSVFLRDFSANPKNFEPTVNNVSKDFWSNYIARFKRRADSHRFGQSEDTAQTQISFYVKNNNGENLEETIKAVALQGKDPHSSMEKIKRQARSSIVQVDTVGVFFDLNLNRVQLVLHGGLMFRLTGNKVTVSGFKYVGNSPHEYELGEMRGFGVIEFNVLKSLITRLAGQANQPHHPKKQKPTKI